VSRIPSGPRPLQRCLGPELTAYADRALSPAELRSWDRHLVACTCCRQAVEAEKRVLGALRASAGPAVPSDLRAVLLSMASGGVPADDPAGAPCADGFAAVREVRPLRIPPPPVPVVDRCAPAMHRSVMRATVFAGLAAGASAAAAWSFAVVGGPLAPTSPSTPAPGTAVQRARPASPSFTSASFGASLRARAQLPVSATTVVFSGAGRPVVSGPQRGSAQSLP
jgi:hypothetical protein